jgi:DNA-directed RNA polymerase specialized sigma24 family protein
VGQETDPERTDEPGFFLGSVPSVETAPEDLVVMCAEARRRVGRLKPDQRTALIMRLAGFSYKEIAGARGWTGTKVNRCVTEGRAALRKTGALA